MSRRRSGLLDEFTFNYLTFLKEYRLTSKALGIVKDSSLSLASDIPRSWYWDLLNDIALDLPLVSQITPILSVTQ